MVNDINHSATEVPISSTLVLALLIYCIRNAEYGYCFILLLCDEKIKLTIFVKTFGYKHNAID